MAGAWLAGTLAAHQLPALPAASWYGVLALAALLLLQTSRLRWLLAALAAFAWTAQAAGNRLEERLPPAALGGDFAVSGWIDEFPVAAPGQVSFSLAVESAQDAAVPRRLRLTWYSPPAPLAAGQPLELVVRLRPPRGLANPGGFDYERWLLTEGYGATGYVRSGSIAAERGGPLARRWTAFRAAIAERIERAAPSEEAGALLIALAIGERFGFAERHWRDFRRTGTSHLVAVSGMHVALLGMAAFWIVRRAWLRLPAAAAAYDLECAAIASGTATAFYALLTGFALPAQRSMLMILVGLALLVSRRTVDAWHAVAAALLAVLVWDPFAPLAASFWLSFGAVALLLLLAAPRRLRAGAARGARVATALRTMTALQWSIGIALLPLSAMFFGEVSVVGPLVNLVAIPWFNLLLVPLTLLATVLLALEPLGAAATALAGHLAGATLAALGAVGALDLAALGVPEPAPLAVLLACAAALLSLPANPLPGRRLAWLGFVPLFAPPAPRLAPGAVEITVLDVGHGLAALVETRSHRLLFDAGARYPSGFDVGGDIVVPLVARGGLDKLVVSHADNDHAGGVPAVLEALPSVDVLRGPDVRLGEGQRCRAGQRWTWDGVEIAVLHPAPGFLPLGNESSCVLKVSGAGGAVLLTGDIEARAERLLARDPRVRADAVIVPHHGSATSSSAAFVAATGASLALVSAGYANRWGFPREEVRRRWEAAGADLWVTGDVGAITVTLDAAGIAVTAERLQRRRYWHAAPPL